jgi:3',5'-cyclic AMP phosphodiesterase CpdA
VPNFQSTESPAPRSLVIAHLTDPHIPLGTPSLAEAAGKRGFSWLNWLRNRRHLHRPGIAARIVADLRDSHPDFIAMTGDLVNFSLDLEFARGAEWLAELGPPDRVGVIPGNHEALVRGFESRMLRHWGPYVAGDGGRPGFPWLRRRGDVAVIGVSSAVPTPLLFATGRVGQAQRAGLARLLAETGRQGLCRVVLIHHPPTPIVQWRKALRDRAEVAAVIAEAGAELVLHGHSHRADLSWIDTPSGRVPVIGAPSASMIPGPGHDAGAWRRLEISRDGAGWRLDLRERRATPAGGIADGPHLRLRLPVADIARARAAQ